MSANSMNLLANNFENLKVSTMTTIVKTNMVFDLEKLYNILEPELPFQKELSIKEYNNLVLWPNSMFFIKVNDKWRGYIKKNPRRNKRTKGNFINQVTVGLFFTHKINMMVFKSCIKICGCKTSNDAILSVLTLYKKFTRNSHNNELSNIQFVFEDVMINMSFNLPKKIIKRDFAKYLTYNKKSKVSYEPTSQSYINLKLLPTQNIKKKIVIQILQPEILDYFEILDLKTDKDKQSEKDFKLNYPDFENKIVLSLINGKCPKQTSFMIFESRVIMSGNSYFQMKEHYESLINAFNKLYSN